MYLPSFIHKLQNTPVVEHSVSKFLLNNTLRNTNAVRLLGSGIGFKLHDTLHSRVRIQTPFSNHRSHPDSKNPNPNTALESQTPIQTFSIFHESEYRHNLTSESNPAQGSNSVSIFKLYLHTFEVLSLLYLLLLSVFAIFKIVGV